MAIELVDRDVLLVIDVQNDFCDGGALAVPGGQEVVGQRLAAAAATGAGRSGPPGLGGDLPRRAAGRAC